MKVKVPGQVNREYDMARKKIVEPIAAEQKKITARLKKKYPQMYEPMLTRAEKKVISRAAKADRLALEKMVGKKLKKMYGGK
jgi:hypothetical protein